MVTSTRAVCSNSARFRLIVYASLRLIIAVVIRPGEASWSAVQILPVHNSWSEAQVAEQRHGNIGISRRRSLRLALRHTNTRAIL